jgi:aspergillopepsin I
MFSPLDLRLLCAASVILLTPCAATPLAHRSVSGSLRVATGTAKAFAAAAPIVQTENYAVLQRSKGTPRSAAYLHALRSARNGGSSPLIPEGGGVEYLMDIQFNQVDVKVIVDTGSSDTWLIESGFRCVNASGISQNASACGFGATYPTSFGANQIKNTNLNISYGDGEFVAGDFGTADITVAGITVPQQTVSGPTSPSATRANQCSPLWAHMPIGTAMAFPLACSDWHMMRSRLSTTGLIPPKTATTTEFSTTQFLRPCIRLAFRRQCLAWQ